MYPIRPISDDVLALSHLTVENALSNHSLGAAGTNYGPWERSPLAPSKNGIIAELEKQNISKDKKNRIVGSEWFAILSDDDVKVTLNDLLDKDELVENVATTATMSAAEFVRMWLADDGQLFDATLSPSYRSSAAINLVRGTKFFTEWRVHLPITIDELAVVRRQWNSLLPWDKITVGEFAKAIQYKRSELVQSPSLIAHELEVLVEDWRSQVQDDEALLCLLLVLSHAQIAKADYSGWADLFSRRGYETITPLTDAEVFDINTIESALDNDIDPNLFGSMLLLKAA
jgi:hypothetical protein